MAGLELHFADVLGRAASHPNSSRRVSVQALYRTPREAAVIASFGLASGLRRCVPMTPSDPEARRSARSNTAPRRSARRS